MTDRENRSTTSRVVSMRNGGRSLTLYYVRLDQAGERKPSSVPFCTVCSRLALDVGITTFALWHETGIVCYETGDYNDRSYAYHRADTPLA